MCSAVLLSGATGFLGTAIARELVCNTNATVHAIVRPQPGRTGFQRLESLWCEIPQLSEALGTRIIAVEGNIEHENLGLLPNLYDELVRGVDVVVHAAAEVRVNAASEHYWNTNVCGTAHMLEFAKAAMKRGDFRRFVHISTAYVAGTWQGRVPEALFGDASYNSLYEKSKHEAELLVSAYNVPYTIVRPSQLVGGSQTGFVMTFNTLYYPLKRYLMGKLRVMPARRDLRINMVPVDYVAHLACRAAVATDQPFAHVINAVGRAEELPTLGELVDEVRAWASEHLGMGLCEPVYVPMGGMSALGRLRNLRQSRQEKRKSPISNMLALAPYFCESRAFEVANARRLARREFPAWRAYVPNLLAYAVRRGFLNYTGRTVFEQMLMRLRPEASTHIRCVDVGTDGLKAHEGPEVREQILAIASALMAYGIKPGDRVATLGVNSVRYFELDAALGLVGAVNVPIYYTSAISDVESLVAASGSRVLFAGTDRMLRELDLGRLDVPVVSMNTKEDLRAGIESWKAFVSRGEGGSTRLPYVSMEQMATIRYTSGTTGAPKGVTFTQRQVRWMGEVMPAVLDWKTRTSGTVRYLSFLPMSHVVEGILVAYAPYYILSNIQMYYLNDFPRLAEVLPKVRPNLFFSVPRFYEKVWNQFAATDAGRFWIGLPNGILKRVLAHPLRYIVLRRAGLDRCRQLIVGSAPIGMDLLEAYRSLGVEIHNAFGVTEAPLITLSRLGDNELGSVGQLLPQTEARLDKENVVWVRGPQVTYGYDGSDESAVDADGWFCTGDMGAWSPLGNLILNGRKKEILVTSYGKNIAPQKIEVMLKGIHGVSEAMVVADGRPYTSALLWLEDEVARSSTEGKHFDFAALDVAVKQMNDHLSHPEQVKRWIVCARPLTVAAGELTPNLKVRRSVVEGSRTEAVNALYAANASRAWLEGVVDCLHGGEAQ